MFARRRNWKDGSKVWYWSGRHWHWGFIERPTDPDHSSYFVRVEGDPLRVVTVNRDELQHY